MVVWVYAGGGQAELGIIPWLQRHFPQITFERRMPQIRKPGPRPGGSVKPKVVGNTGSALDTEIRRNLQKYWGREVADILLLVDDTDCAKPQERRASLNKVVVEAIPSETPPILIALAVPELEVWLLADWENTFHKLYPQCQVPLRRSLQKEGVDFENLQGFDCFCDTPRYRKISEVLRNVFDVCCGPGPRYSKDTDTRRLLLEVNPEKVATHCPDFKVFWNELILKHPVNPV